MVKKVIIISSCLLVSAIGLTQQTHVVKRGETLWGISANYLDDPFHWWQIYKANSDQIEDPHWIYPGQTFIIPYSAGELTSAEMEVSTAETSQIFAKERPISEEEFVKPIEEEEFRSLIAAKKEGSRSMEAGGARSSTLSRLSCRVYNKRTTQMG